MEILVLDAPLVDELRVLGILEVDDVEALGAHGPVLHASDVGERAVHLLLELHVRHGQTGPERDVAEHFDVVAAPL